MIPSHKTIFRKIELAKQAIKRGDIFLVDPDVIVADLIELGRTVDEIPRILHELLEITNPNHYAGTRPPQKSYEPVITGCELYAFKTISKMIGCAIYYKFTINNDVLWLISLHKDRPKKKGK